MPANQVSEGNDAEYIRSMLSDAIHTRENPRLKNNVWPEERLTQCRFNALGYAGDDARTIEKHVTVESIDNPENLNYRNCTAAVLLREADRMAREHSDKWSDLKTTLEKSIEKNGGKVTPAFNALRKFQKDHDITPVTLKDMRKARNAEIITSFMKGEVDTTELDKNSINKACYIRKHLPQEASRDIDGDITIYRLRALEEMGKEDLNLNPESTRKSLIILTCTGLNPDAVTFFRNAHKVAQQYPNEWPELKQKLKESIKKNDGKITPALKELKGVMNDNGINTSSVGGSLWKKVKKDTIGRFTNAEQSREETASLLTGQNR